MKDLLGFMLREYKGGIEYEIVGWGKALEGTRMRIGVGNRDEGGLDVIVDGDYVDCMDDVDVIVVEVDDIEVNFDCLMMNNADNSCYDFVVDV